MQKKSEKKKGLTELIDIGREVTFRLLTKKQAKEFVMGMKGTLRVKKILISRINHEKYRGEYATACLVKFPDHKKEDVQGLVNFIKRRKKMVSPGYIEKISYLFRTGSRFLLRDVAIQKRPIKPEDMAHIVTSIGLFRKPEIKEVPPGDELGNPYFLFVRPFEKIKLDETKQKKNNEPMPDKQIIAHEQSKFKRNNTRSVHINHPVGV